MARKAYLRDFVRAVEKEGMTVLSERQKGGHFQYDVRLKNGACVDVRLAGTPRCQHHAIDNNIKVLRRYENGTLAYNPALISA